MAAQTEILIAEDEPVIREGLVELLQSEGYVVRAAVDGVQALEMFHERHPDVVLLDAMMPRKNGYVVCSEIRAVDASLPILFLTAKDGDADELRGLALGADDYVSKTTSLAILLARVAAVVRRAQIRTATGASNGHFRIGCWDVDAVNCMLVSESGERRELSFREVELLRFLVRHPGETHSRDSLLTKFWGRDFDGDENVLSVTVCRLREKLGPSGDCIQTLHRKGYRYSPL